VVNALVSSKQIRFKQTSETVCTDGRVRDEIREKVPDCGVLSVSVQLVARYCKWLTVGGMQMPLSVSTGDQYAVVRRVQ